MNFEKETEKAKFLYLNVKVEQALISTIESEFPQYAIPKHCFEVRSLSGVRHNAHEIKMGQLRELFRLREFATSFNDDFERIRNEAREEFGLSEKIITSTGIGAYTMFMKDGGTADSWKTLPDDKKLEYKEIAQRVRAIRKKNQDEFMQNHLTKLLNDPEKFYWILRVSFHDKSLLTICNISGSGGKGGAPERRT